MLSLISVIFVVFTAVSAYFILYGDMGNEKKELLVFANLTVLIISEFALLLFNGEAATIVFFDVFLIDIVVAGIYLLKNAGMITD